MPSDMLRDWGLPQVSTRSPSPERPIIVSSRAPRPTPNRAISAKPRVTSPAWALAPKRLADDDARGDGVDVLHGAADLGADHVAAPIAAERRVA